MKAGLRPFANFMLKMVRPACHLRLWRPHTVNGHVFDPIVGRPILAAAAFEAAPTGTRAKVAQTEQAFLATVKIPEYGVQGHGAFFVKSVKVEMM
jgi:hypothetical protein